MGELLCLFADCNFCFVKGMTEAVPIKDFVLKGVEITKQSNFISANTSMADLRASILGFRLKSAIDYFNI
jgi:hypothetical protein